MPASLMEWNALPHEIQVLILSQVSSTFCDGHHRSMKALSQYMLVCQLWNVEIQRLVVQFHSAKCVVKFASESIALKAIQRHLALGLPLEQVEYEDELDDARFEFTCDLHELLEDAIHRGHISCAKLLLENGASWHGGVMGGKSVYHLAVASGKPNRAEMLRLLNIYFLDAPDLELEDRDQSLTPLALAISSNDLIAVEQLILLGADIQCAILWDSLEGPFTYAINSNKITLLKLLLASGEDPDTEDADDPTYPTQLTLALEKNKKDIIEVLLDSGSPVNTPEKNLQPLSAAVLRCSLDTIKDLINRGAYVNYSGDYGTALSRAVRYRDLSIIRLLLDHDAEITQAVCREARRRGCRQVATLLLERFIRKEEPSVNFTLGPNNRLIWLHPFSPGQQIIVNLLLEAGADVSVLGNIQKPSYDRILEWQQPYQR